MVTERGTELLKIYIYINNYLRECSGAAILFPDTTEPRTFTTRQAQVAINVWLRQYNQIRPHHALNMKTPVPESLLEKTKISGTEKWG